MIVKYSLFLHKINWQTKSWYSFPLSSITTDYLGGSDGKDSSCHAGDLGLIPGWGRSLWEGNGNPLQYVLGFPGGSMVKHLSVNAGNVGLIPELGWSSGVGNGNPLQYSCLENSMDRGAWKAMVHRVKKSLPQLSTHIHTEPWPNELCRG